ncbi:MAG: OmpA family protein [Bacteroidota bacterium]|nr:OmpA family protein [Bacteroidota bacterium]
MKAKIFTCIMLLFLLISAFEVGAQIDKPKFISPKAKKLFQSGMNYFRQHNIDEAEKAFTKAVELSPEFEEAWLMLADVQYGYNLNKAEKTLVKMQEALPTNPKAKMGLGLIYLKQKKFQLAKEQYKLAIANENLSDEERKSAKRQFISATVKDSLYSNPIPFKPEQLSDEINTNLEEYLPSFDITGNQLLFTRRLGIPSNYKTRYNGDFQEDLHISYKSEKGKWSRAIPLEGQINTLNNEGGSCLSPDGRYLLFTGCERNDGLGLCDLFISFYRGGEWTKPINIGEPINTKYSEKQPSISGDGKWLYFASNGVGSLGKLDIYRATISIVNQQLLFGEPINLGNAINTPNDDQTPFIHADGRSLYYTTNGLPGLGQNDLFISRWDGSNWSTPKNLGYPLNTELDEQGLVVEPAGVYAYMGTNNLNNTKNNDIIRFALPSFDSPDPVTYLKAKIVDAATNVSIVGYVLLNSILDTRVLTPDQSINDSVHLIMVPYHSTLALLSGAKGYLPYSENLDLSNYNSTEPFNRTIKLKKIKAGEKVALNNLFFDVDKWDLKPTSISELRTLVYFLTSNANINIEISGHTDQTGDAKKNMVLSAKRAKAVYDYLILNDIKASRLTFKGFGSTQPLFKGQTDESYAKNRRTEIKVLP